MPILAGMGGIANQMLGQMNQLNLMGTQQGYNEYNAIMGPQWQVEGLRQAGMNPMLAVDRPAPMMPMPSAQPASTPAASMGAAASAMSAVAQAKQANAQADLLNSQNLDKAGQVMPLNKDGTVDWDTYFTGPYQGKQPMINAMQMAQNINVAKATEDQIRQSVATGVATENLNNALAKQADMNRSVAQGLYQYTMKQAAADAGIAEANMTEQQAEAKIMGGKYGPALIAMQKVLGIAGQAMSLATPGRALLNPLPKGGGINVFNVNRDTGEITR